MAEKNKKAKEKKDAKAALKAELEESPYSQADGSSSSRINTGTPITGANKPKITRP